MRHAIRALILTIFAAACGAVSARAQPLGTVSGLPIPRFVSLKADKINVHIGPAKNYEVKWVYQRAGLPVEITAEFENWRRVRDSDGTEGWVYHSLLSGRRAGVVTAKTKEEMVPIHVKPDAKSTIAAKLQPGVLASVKHCTGSWCRVTGRGFEGFIPQQRLWGVYPGETVE
jgi:SH3-like domain-containing protein